MSVLREQNVVGRRQERALTSISKPPSLHRAGEKEQNKKRQMRKDDYVHVMETTRVTTPPSPEDVTMNDTDPGS